MMKRTLFFAALAFCGCHAADRETERIRAERDALALQVEALRKENTRLGEELERLQATPRAFFDRAVEAEARALAAPSDAADRAAAQAFQEVVARFPGDPLAAAASQRVAALQRRLSQRAAALAGTRKRLHAHLDRCREETAKASQARIESIRFRYTFMRQEMDMNTALEGNRRAQAHSKKALRAQQEALALLTEALDPDGALRKEIDRCTEEEE